MEKNYDINSITKTVLKNYEFFMDHYYHSIIDSNPAKIDSILKNGIMCKKEIERVGTVAIYTHLSDYFDSKNGSTYVSLSKYEGDINFNQIFSSFALHTLTSISFMINKDIEVSNYGEKETYFDDEIFCKGKIDPSKIEGIIVPSKLSKTKVKRTSFLTNDLSNYTTRYLQNWLEAMRDYYRCNIPQKFVDELNTSKQQFWDVCDDYSDPSRWVGGVLRTQKNRYGKDIKDVIAIIVNYLCVQKYGMDNPTMMELLMKINTNNVPIYEISSKSLSRVR